VGGRIDATAMVRVDRYQRIGGDRPAPPQPACSLARRCGWRFWARRCARASVTRRVADGAVLRFLHCTACQVESGVYRVIDVAALAVRGPRSRQCPDRCSHHDLRGPAGDADLRVAACAPTARRDLDPGRCASTRRVRCLVIDHGVGAPSRIDQRTTLRRSGRSGSIGGTWSAASSRASGEA